MSERAIEVDLTQNTETRADLAQAANPSDEERAAFRGRLAQVLDRTMTVDRLNVNLPEHLEGRWESHDALSIAQAELRGFVVDTEFATRSGLNDAADGKARIADVIHMVRPKWQGEEEEKVKRQRYYETHIKDKRKQKEERDFLAQNELPALVGSKAVIVTGSEIQESLKSK